MEKELITLGQWEKAKQAITECKSIDELKQIKDKAEALRAYAKQAQESLEVQNNVADIKLRAERRIGEFSRELPKQERKRTDLTASHSGEQTKSQILNQAGIKHHERYEAIANLPEEEFEKHIEEVKKSNQELTTTGVIKLARQIEKEERIKKEKEIKITSDIDIRKGDFKVVLDDLSQIDAIITDPPYPKEYINCFSELGEYAKYHLKDDGFVAVYTGQYHLPEVIERLSEHLTYVWTFCLYHTGKKQLVNGVNIMCGWKPVLIFSKGKKKMRYSAYDVLISKEREKENHIWQQSESGVIELINILTKPGDLVVDTFAGSGSFLKAAQKNNRRAIGAEIND